jgi:hypothetical protein
MTEAYERGRTGITETLNDAELYRCGSLSRWRQGPGNELVYFHQPGVYRCLSSLMASALGSWTFFLTVTDAAKQLAAGIPSLPADQIVITISDLIECGALISRSQLMSRAIPEVPQGCSGIDWLAIPTADRSASLGRAADSYLENARHFGRRCNLFVSDGSRGSDSCTNNVAVLTPRLKVCNGAIWYAGRSEKADFVRLLTENGSICPDVAGFCLFGSDSSPLTPGANRNAILLHTLGSGILSVDDDTICSPASVESPNVGLSIAGHYDPSEIWCFPDFSSALAFGNPHSLDVLGEHENYLGASIGELLSTANLRGVVGSLDKLCGHVINSLWSADGSIRVTYNGARGDSGFHSDLGVIASRLTSVRRRVQRLGGKYNGVLASRQIVRQALSATISHADSAAVGMCMGLDNRGLLPPFMPDCRKEDGIFAGFLARTSDHHYVTHLPFTLVHEPVGSREYLAGRDTAIRFADIILALLSTWTPELGNHDPCGRIVSAGRHFSLLGRLPPDEFDELTNNLMCGRISSTIELLEGLLAEDSRNVPGWAADLTSRVHALRLITRDPTRLAPLDVPAYSNEPSRRCAQRLTGRYGQLLQSWPAIVERTIELRNRGIYLGRRIVG